MLKSFLGMFSNDIAIDLGTENIRVFKRGEGVIADEKSIIAVEESQNQKVIKAIGQKAIDIKHFKPIKEGVISNLYAEMMIRYFIELAHNRKGLFAPKVIVSVPYQITSIQMVAVKEMIFSAGARVVFLVEKPMATAMGAGLPIKESSKHLIVDIGAGTTDIAILSEGGIIYGKSITVAGDTIDRAIISYLKKKFNLTLNQKEAQRLKIDIATAIELSQELFSTLEYFDEVNSSVKSIKISSEDIRKAIDRPLQDITEAIKEVLDYRPFSKEEQKKIDTIGAIKRDERFKDKRLDKIVLSGGTSLIRSLDRYLSDKLKIRVELSSNPKMDTINGLGMILEDIDVFIF